MSLYDNNWFYLIMFLMTVFIELGWIILQNGKNSVVSSGCHTNHEDTYQSFSSAIRSKRTDVLITVFLALAVSSLFRLFPGNSSHPGVDSSAFLYIGKRMLEGRQPYHDMFDHKGPLLYIIEVIGLRIGAGNQTGVWFVELISIFFTAFFMLKLSKLIAKYRMCTYLSTLLVLGVCGWKVYQGGNFTEEYALPWISCSAVIFCSFFKNKKYQNRDIILLGVAFQIVFLMRANMIAIWVAFIPVVLIRFTKEKRYREMLECMYLFFVGIVLVTTPVFIWAYKNKFLADLWEYYFQFNFLYTDNVNRSSHNFLNLFFRFAMVLWPGVISSFLQMLIQPKNKLLMINNWFIVVSIAMACLSGRYYFHYAITILPALVLPVAAFYDQTAGLILRKLPMNRENNGKGRRSAGENQEGLHPKDSIMILTFSIILIVAVGYRMVSKGENQDDSATQYLIENTESSDDVLVLGNSAWCYLLSDRKTENRFFYQLPPLSISSKLYDEFVEELINKPSDYILIPGNLDERNAINYELNDIKEVLNQHPSEQYKTETADQYEVFVRIR